MSLYVDFTIIDAKSLYRVVADVTARGSEMDDGSSFGTLVAENVDVSHDVVSGCLFLFGSRIEIDVVYVRLHLCDLGRRYCQTKILKGNDQLLKNIHQYSYSTVHYSTM